MGYRVFNCTSFLHKNSTRISISKYFTEILETSSRLRFICYIDIAPFQ